MGVFGLFGFFGFLGKLFLAALGNASVLAFFAFHDLLVEENAPDGVGTLGTFADPVFDTFLFEGRGDWVGAWVIVP